MRSTLSLTVSLLILLLIVAGPVTVSAASFDFTVTAKKAFDKMKASTDKATAAKFTSQYAELLKVQKQDVEWDLKISKLHYQNEETELAVNKRIKEIDTAKLAKLEADITRVKEKYEPLFRLYDTQKNQHSLAKKSKIKLLSSMLSQQVEMTKAAVQIAKQDIKNKDTILKNAKAAKTKTSNKIKDIMAGIKPIEVKIKSAKSTISSTKKQFTTETTILNQVVRKEDQTAALSSFTRSLAFMKQIQDQKQKVFAYEQQIAAIIAKADVQLGTK